MVSNLLPLLSQDVVFQLTFMKNTIFDRSEY